MIVVGRLFVRNWLFYVIFLSFSVVDIVAEKGLVGLDVYEVVFVGE